ncbi:hypothetical protein KXD93_04150 [Mucilaginibacter sp. BJC16-A38]|uniref:hypothetical protein n=1 Tax=Mucilaginibacter phenanthrenivorans TaxID=1234842 RepID=UPI0021572E01|nr:hypothetical protein [Mucilaginibacter phenanthrenivorans]MCR8556815.1 hypothetical protein [Mucilaginibacter phenanthrenivorans]
MEQVKIKKPLAWIILTGLLTGTIDALIVILINYDVPAGSIFKFIASGIFGKAAFGTGNEMIYYGVLFHYSIAFIWTTVFFLFYTRLITILKFRSALMLTIAIVIWMGMNLVVLPLSNTPPQPHHFIGILKNIGILALAYGLPIVVIADKFYTSPLLLFIEA